MGTGDISANAAKEIVLIVEAGVLADVRAGQGMEMEVGVLLVEGGPRGSTVRL